MGKILTREEQDKLIEERQRKLKARQEFFKKEGVGNILLDKLKEKNDKHKI